MYFIKNVSCPFLTVAELFNKQTYYTNTVCMLCCIYLVIVFNAAFKKFWSLDYSWDKVL